jgi:predicted ArsR family transcriptional regulator
VPPLRRAAYEHLNSLAPDLTGFAKAETPAIAKALRLPTVTVRRALEDLAAYGLVERVSHGSGKADLWKAHPWEGES